MRCLGRCLLALLALLPNCVFSAADAPEIRDSANLANGLTISASSEQQHSEEPETTAFDLYLGDALIGVAIVNYTSTYAELLDPNDAVEQLKGIKSPEAFKELLSGRIAGSREREGVGRVFADMTTFRLVVEPEAEQLKAKQITLKDRLTDAAAGASLQQIFGIATSGEFDSLDSRSLRHLTIMGYGPYRMRYDGTLIQGQLHEVSDLSLGGVIDTF